jgi:hypothetical protein
MTTCNSRESSGKLLCFVLNSILILTLVPIIPVSFVPFARRISRVIELKNVLNVCLGIDFISYNDFTIVFCNCSDCFILSFNYYVYVMSSIYFYEYIQSDYNYMLYKRAMVSFFASIAVGRGFEARSGQTKGHRICICCISATNAGLMSKNKDCFFLN